MSQTPNTVEHLIDLVRKLDAVMQERADAVAPYDARIGDLKAQIASSMGGAAPPAAATSEADSALPSDDGRPPLREGSHAAKVFQMIKNGTFTVGAGAEAVYKADANDPTARKNVRSILKYLVKSGWITRDGDDVEVAV